MAAVLQQSPVPPGYIDIQLITGPNVNNGVWSELVAHAGKGIIANSQTIYGQILRDSPPLFEVHPVNLNQTFSPWGAAIVRGSASRIFGG